MVPNSSFCICDARQGGTPKPRWPLAGTVLGSANKRCLRETAKLMESRNLLLCVCFLQTVCLLFLEVLPQPCSQHQQDLPVAAAESSSKFPSTWRISFFGPLSQSVLLIIWVLVSRGSFSRLRYPAPGLRPPPSPSSPSSDV